MKSIEKIFVGKNLTHNKENQVSGSEVTIGNELFYKICNVDAMRPFFMSIVSNSNHWLFISSSGGLSAGRKNSNHALFPYYTDDKITESSEYSGSKSIFLITNSSITSLWEPFSKRHQGIYNVTINLYKNIYGNKHIFEEINAEVVVYFIFYVN